jgi:hypothetical protein
LHASPKLIVGWVGQLLDEVGRGDSALGVDVQLDLEEVLLEGADEVEDQLDDEILVVFFKIFVCDEESNVVILHRVGPTLIGFLRMSSKASAREATMDENLLAMSLSISSFFLSVKLIYVITAVLCRN